MNKPHFTCRVCNAGPFPGNGRTTNSLGPLCTGCSHSVQHERFTEIIIKLLHRISALEKSQNG